MHAETELKYAPPSHFSSDMLFSLPEIAPYLGKISEIEMSTEYLDTPTGAARARGISLRRRLENEKSILYAKTSSLRSGELSMRGEWSVESDDIANAAKLLAGAGAPTGELISMPLIVRGKVSFLRREACLSLPDGLTVMLSYDEGIFRDDTPFSEIELELISGDEDELLRFGRELSSKYGFTPEQRSKHLRSLFD